MELRTPRLHLRAWRRGDEAALVTHANHRDVWINLADYFPHPYTEADADAWIARTEADRSGSLHLAILVDEEGVFEWNPASCRVLEKAGFTREARMRSGAFKHGQLIDAWLYARIRG